MTDPPMCTSHLDLTVLICRMRLGGEAITVKTVQERYCRLDWKIRTRMAINLGTIPGLMMEMAKAGGLVVTALTEGAMA